MSKLHEDAAKSYPALQRGLVWCRHCRREERVDAAHAMQYGWPTCCGFTMSIDRPEERQQRTTLRALEAQEGEG